jgi:hypothetical protein
MRQLPQKRPVKVNNKKSQKPIAPNTLLAHIKTKFYQVRLRAVVITFTLILILGLGYLVTQKGVIILSKFAIEDKYKAEDLYRTQEAIIDYFNKNRKLPASLADLNLNLKGKVSDYNYSYESATTNGGPTVGYKICATFKTPGLSTDNLNLAPGQDFYDLGSEPSAYLYHRKGQQCFANAYYKGTSHVQLLLNEDEILPIKTYKTDFTELETTAWSYYSAQAQVLGINPAQNDLVKNCVKRKELSSAANKTAFSCYIKIRKIISVTKNTDELIGRFKTLVESQGFAYPIVNDYGNSKTLTANKDICRLEASFAPESWGVDYRLFCTSSDTSEIPSGFTQVDTYNLY